jgi:putative transposase
MKKQRFTEEQILKVLKEVTEGVAASEVCRKHGVATSTLYKWKEKYAGMTESELKKLRLLEQENQRLKRMYADLSIDHAILKDIIAKKL